MAYTTINKSTDYFNTKLYTGTGSELAITGVGHQPDWVWIKDRDSAGNSHNLTDSVRGAGKGLFTNLTSAEYDYGTGASGSVKSFNSDGYTLGTASQVNANGTNFASWNWKANGAGSANTDGSINSTVSVNSTAGFSIVKWTGDPSSSATIGHGLGVVPSMIITKSRGSTDNWVIYHKDLGASAYIELDNAGAKGTSGSVYRWNNTAPTNSVFSVGAGSGTNNSSQIAYCFAEKTGYSKFGSYTGNGNADGTFVYTGFKPAFIIVKKSNASEDWEMFDNKRLGYNVDNNNLVPNSNSAEATSDRLDIVSNGFKFRASSGSVNASGDTYIYMAFGQSLVGSNNVPCAAR
jgi:hypothetical protein